MRSSQHERDAGLELLTRVNGGFRPRAVDWTRDMIQSEIDAGHYRAPADPELLADGDHHHRRALPAPRRRPRRHPRPRPRRPDDRRAAPGGLRLASGRIMTQP